MTVEDTTIGFSAKHLYQMADYFNTNQIPVLGAALDAETSLGVVEFIVKSYQAKFGDEPMLLITGKAYNDCIKSSGRLIEGLTVSTEFEAIGHGDLSSFSNFIVLEEIDSTAEMQIIKLAIQNERKLNPDINIAYIFEGPLNDTVIEPWGDDAFIIYSDDGSPMTPVYDPISAAHLVHKALLTADNMGNMPMHFYPYFTFTNEQIRAAISHLELMRIVTREDSKLELTGVGENCNDLKVSFRTAALLGAANADGCLGKAFLLAAVFETGDIRHDKEKGSAIFKGMTITSEPLQYARYLASIFSKTRRIDGTIHTLLDHEGMRGYRVSAILKLVSEFETLLEIKADFRDYLDIENTTFEKSARNWIFAANIDRMFPIERDTVAIPKMHITENIFSEKALFSRHLILSEDRRDADFYTGTVHGIYGPKVNKPMAIIDDVTAYTAEEVHEGLKAYGLDQLKVIYENMSDTAPIDVYYNIKSNQLIDLRKYAKPTATPRRQGTNARVFGSLLNEALVRK